ncbi:hypothetical protein HCG49_00250 [Arenibacter sp. 6A1]|uniref:hypothetical protein n=1 Tax=Arenibacter sp. 6A1 TaxID=2720391 RepID=UPI001447781A|nr:hypothetical protein [Arenibacter sp. 6A1]NKI24985.1 hypothetical protein [Arenibacter sp. 6A1]
MIKNGKNNSGEDEVENFKNKNTQGKPVIPIGKTVSPKNVLAPYSDGENSLEIDPKIRHQMRVLLKKYMQQNKEDIQFKAVRNTIPLTGLPIPPVTAYSLEDRNRIKTIYAIYETADFCNVAVLRQLEDLLKEEKNESIGCLIRDVISKFYSEDDQLIKESRYL